MHLYLRQVVLGVCPKCGKKVLPHTICWNCGYYKGEKVVDVMKKLNKKEKKQKEKEIADKNKETEKKEPLSMEKLSRQ